jgi:hypothetical protein
MVLVLYIGVFPQRLIDLTQKAAMSQGLKTYSYQEGPKKPAAPGAVPGGIPGESEENESGPPRR